MAGSIFEGLPPEWLEQYLGQVAPPQAAPDPAYEQARAADVDAQRNADLQSAFTRAASLVRNQPVAPVPFRQLGDENMRAWVAQKELTGRDADRAYRGSEPMRALMLEDVRGQRAASAAEAARVAQEERDARQNAAAMERAKVMGGMRAEVAKTTAETKAGVRTVKDAMDLRKEFQGDPVVKATKDMGQAIAKIRSAPENGTGDLGLIYSYVKLLDPGSVVREGEIVLAREPTPTLTRLQAAYKKAAEGDLLHPDLRKAYKEAAEKLWEAQRGSYQPVADEYTRLAKHFGVDPSTVVLDLGFGPPAAAGASTVTVLWKGKRKEIPAERLQEAIAAGAQEVK